MSRLLCALILVSVPLPALAAPCTELPVLFIVQDKSGSMAGVPDPVNAPSAPSKWSSSKAVVPSLAAQFSNRFRFGVMMFPDTSSTFNCSTGTTLAPVPASATDVSNAYNWAAAGGGTPTATSLTQAKSYLLGLGLATPAYVLLITDGLPNCNSANNPATCQTTTAGCLNTSTCTGSSCCGLGAKDCLDNNATVSAAAALNAAGIKVYVVGFGASVSSANDKTVLDAIAAAGGTGTSYVATNQSALSSTLNTIALNTATCCLNACTQGAAVCNAQGQRQSCALDAATGCTTWTTSSCPAMSACAGGVCQSCTNACTNGAMRCSGGAAQSCQVQANGCTAWTTTQSCGYGQLCSGVQCVSCQQCAIGAAQCTATGVQTCDWDVLSGCTTWKASVCTTGTRCVSGSCATCNSTCTAGAKRCAGNNVESCVADAQGCTTWQPGQTCGNFCSGGACGVCGTTCTVGAARCNGNGVETCAKDANNCTVWNPGSTCATGTSCNGGACTACAVSCSVGAKRCAAAGGLESCTATATGCPVWAPSGSCAANETCQGGACIPPCQNDCTEGAAKCETNAPSKCEKAPTGCTVWKAQPSCGTAAACVTGTCRATCVQSELEMCPTGEECTGLPAGIQVCLPKTGSTPTPDAGTPPAAADAGTKSPDKPKRVPADDPAVDPNAETSAGSGCGCTTGGALAPWALLGLAALTRRRRATSKGSL